MKEYVLQARRVSSSSARAEGAVIDPPGRRLEQLQHVFSDLIAVAHRQHLPWEIHLLRHPRVGAMTPGGGMVSDFDAAITVLQCVSPESSPSGRPGLSLKPTWARPLAMLSATWSP